MMLEYYDKTCLRKSFVNYIEFHEVPAHCILFMLTDWIWDLIRGRCLKFVHFATTVCLQRASLFCEPYLTPSRKVVT